MVEWEVADTMVNLLRMRAERHADVCGYTFCSDEGEQVRLGVSDLARRAQAIAAELQQFSRPGDRALLVYPAGLDFLPAFFGCMFAGVLPVPATYPRPRRPMPRLAAISADCRATIALTTSGTLETLALARSAPELRTLRWLATDAIADDAAASWRDPQCGPDDLAFLQYTSGSTSKPKGVMVSHRNLLHNLQMIRQGFDIPGRHADGVQPVGVSWLPAYHDMGLIGSLLNTLYNAFHTTLISPTSFLQRPFGWLQLLSSQRATITGAPSFAYEMCVARTTSEERAGLDLSSLRLAACAAEPIHEGTLRRFAAAFATCGFSADAFYPCYGLAEATLLAAGGQGPARPTVLSVCRSSLAEHQVRMADSQAEARTLVACGSAFGGQEIAIVDPLEQRRVPADQVGEIWVRGTSVSRGYWERPDETNRTFAARITGEDDRSYLRSGDLGFFNDGQLYVTGRLKDMIIVRGRNHYPQDIERTVGLAHPLLHPDRVAAVSIDGDPEERLVVISEVDRGHQDAEFGDVFRAIRRAVAAEHELPVEAIVLIRQAGLPRTTSGKLQRSLCRERYLRGDLKVVAQWSLNAAGRAAADLTDSQPGPAIDRPRRLGPFDASEAAPAAGMLAAEHPHQLAERIERRLTEWIMQRCELSAAEVDPHKPFAEFGMDSLSAVELSVELEQWLQVPIPAVAAWNYPTPHAMADYLARRVIGKDAAPETETSQSPAPNAAEFEHLLAAIEGLSEADVQQALNGSHDAASSRLQEEAAKRQAPG